MDERPPLDHVNKILAKHGITPIYEMVYLNTETITKQFVMRLTCQVSSKGPSLMIEGSASSKKDAKRNAARAFIHRYLTIRDDDSASLPLEFVKYVNIVPFVDRHIILEIICSIIILKEPWYQEVTPTGTFRPSCVVVECGVSYLRTRGRGEDKVAAKSDAATKMIQLLMNVESIYNMMKSQYSSPVESADEAQAEDPSEDPAGESPAPTGEDKNTADDKPPEPETNPSSRLIRLRSGKVVANPDIRKKLLNSVNKQDPESSNADKLSISKSNCVSQGDSISRNGNDGTNEIRRTLTSLQLNSKIDRIVEGFEKQLCDQLVETLTYNSPSHPISVSILSQEYEVVLNGSSQPKIFQEGQECKDKTIRIACLVKYFLELKGEVKHSANKWIR